VSTPENCLIADIGGTHTRLAIVNVTHTILHLQSYRNEEFSELGQILDEYISHLPAQCRPDAGVLAVASPVRGDEIQFTNSAWNFSIMEYRSRFTFKFLDVINDFVAVALAIPGLESSDCIKIGKGEAIHDEPIGVIGPGTGLGVSILVPTSGRWMAISSEGGHVTLPAYNDEEERIISRVRERHGHVSAERLISGPGLALLYQTIAELKGVTVTELDPEDITAHDAAGTDQVASYTVDVFMKMLGTIAGDLAVTSGARGGIYIAGGILPKISNRFVNSGFRNRFTDKGRYHDYLEQIPTFLITRDNIGINGLRDYLSEVSDFKHSAEI
jgi:glucokinase